MGKKICIPQDICQSKEIGNINSKLFEAHKWLKSTFSKKHHNKFQLNTPSPCRKVKFTKR